MNRRKILAWLLMLLMLLGMMPEASAFIGPDGQMGAPSHTHNWEGYEPGREATCTEAGYHYLYCTICSQYGEWTDKTVEDPPKGHSWARSNPTSKDRISREPTCTGEGEKKQFCTDCGASRTVSIPALGHDPGSWKTTKKATCTEKGRRETTCQRCGEKITQSISMTDHTWSAWTVIQEPTDWTAGIRERKCTVCGTKQQDKFYKEGTVLPGAQGAAAKHLQELLNANGFDCGKADGAFGPKTEAAVKQAEQAAGHEATGIGWTGLIAWLEAGAKPASGDGEGSALGMAVTYMGAELTFRAGDTVSFGIHLNNGGSVDLKDPWVQAYAGNGDPREEYSDAVLPAGGAVTFQDQYTFTEEDAAAGTVTLRWTAEAVLPGGENDRVGPNEFTFTALPSSGEVAPSGGEASSGEGALSVGAESKDYNEMGGAVTLRFTNTGSVPLSIHRLEIVDLNGYNTPQDKMVGEPYGPATEKEQPLMPGDYFFRDFQLSVMQGDIDNDYIVRVFKVWADALELDPETGEYHTVGDLIYDECKVMIPLPAAPSGGDVSIKVALESSGGVLTAQVGEKVNTVLRITNTGGAAVLLTGVDVIDGQPSHTLGADQMSSPYGGTGDEQYHHMFLRPGEFVFVDFTPVISDYDADEGELWRQVTIDAVEASESEGWVSEGTAATSGSCAVSFPLGDAPKEKEELSLTVIPPDYTGWQYSPGETVEIPYTIRNTGKATLYIDVDSFTYEDGTKAPAMEYSGMWPPESDALAPGASFVLKVRTKVTEQDAEGEFATRLFTAVGLVQGTEKAVLAQTVDVHWAIRDAVEFTGGDMSLKAVSADDTSLWASQVGDQVTLHYTVTNTGKATLYVDKESFTYENGGDAEFISFTDSWPPKADALAPGDSFTLKFDTVVTDVDAAAGKVIRVLTMNGYEIGRKEAGLCYAEPVTVTWALGEGGEPGGKADAEPAVTLTVKSVGTASAALGDVFDVVYTVTNTGKVPLEASGFTNRLADDTFPSADVYGFLEPKALHLVPGDSFEFTLTVHVTEADLPFDQVCRKLKATARVLEGERKDEIVTDTATWSVNLDKKEEGTLDFTAVPEDTSGWTLAVGETATLTVTLTNTGTAPICLFTLSWSNKLNTDGFKAEQWVGKAGDEPLSVGESTKLLITVKALESDLTAGEVARAFKFAGFPADDTNAWDLAVYRTPEVKIGLKDSGTTKPEPPTEIPEEPKLVLEMSFAPVKTGYEPGEEITVSWTLTNIGGEGCAFGGISLSTDPAHLSATRSTFVEKDAAILLSPFGGSHSGTTSLILQESAAIDEVFSAVFEGYGLSPATGETVAVSNKKIETFPLNTDYTGWVIPPDTDPTCVTVEKTVTTTSLLLPGYQEGETVGYLIRITNTGKIDLTDVEVYDPLKGSNEDALVGMILSLPVGASETMTFTHVVTKEDVAAGFINNTATASWIDPGNDERVESPSNPVTVSAFRPEEPLPEGVFAFKYRLTPYPHVSGGKGWFQPGEKVTFLIHVANNTDAPLYGVQVTDPLYSGAEGPLTVSGIPARSAFDFLFTYEVKELDAVMTWVDNNALVTATDDAGAPVATATNTVRVNVLDPDTTPQPGPGTTPHEGGKVVLGQYTHVTVGKKVIGKAVNGSYYREGEIIRYQITVHNAGDATVTDVLVYDALGGVGGSPIGTVASLAPGETRTFYFNYKVTAADVAAGKVVNTALAQFTVEGHCTDTAKSNQVTSDTDGSPDISINDPGDGPGKVLTPVKLPGEDGEYLPCSRTLIARGDGAAMYAVHTCSLHMPAAQAAQEIVSAATTPKEQEDAWKLVQGLWTEEVDALYQALYDASDSVGKATVLNERLMFYAQLKVFGDSLTLVLPSQPETVARMIAVALENRCSALCYLIHTAPGARVDSLLNPGIPDAQGENGAQATCGRALLPLQPGEARLAEFMDGDHAAVDAAMRALLASISPDWQMLGATLPDETLDALRETFDQAAKLWLVQLDQNTNERYRAAGKEDRKLIAADRLTFDNWRTTFEALMTLLYPQGAASVEVPAEAVRARVMDYCIAQHAE